MILSIIISSAYTMFRMIILKFSVPHTITVNYIILYYAILYIVVGTFLRQMNTKVKP